MEETLNDYILAFCRDLMLLEETRAYRRVYLTEYGLETTQRMALNSPKIEEMYGFQDPKTNALVKLGREELKRKIASRILAEHRDEVINNCPRCGKLARTPKAKQCRYCGFDWH